MRSGSVDAVCQPSQRVLQRNDVVQPMAKQVALCGVVRCSGLHEICKVSWACDQKLAVSDHHFCPYLNREQALMDSSGRTNYKSRLNEHSRITILSGIAARPLVVFIAFVTNYPGLPS
jgi:hypothetical protein